MASAAGKLLLMSAVPPRSVPAILASKAGEHRLLSPNIGGEADNVLVRYTYEGGALAEGRLCLLTPRSDRVTGLELLCAMSGDGVDFSNFYACAYERRESAGSWFPVLRSITRPLSTLQIDDDITFSTAVADAPQPSRRGAEPRVPRRARIDVKLCRREAIDEAAASGAPLAAASTTAGAALATATVNLRRAPTSELGAGRYAAIGVVDAKSEENVGTLWRSAYQLGAQFIFTVSRRYVPQRSDTLRVPTRLPLLHFDDWHAFASAAPAGATLVAVEMGGTPLDEFDHPENAVYLLGSEDNGMPPRVLEACGACVALSAERYASYNVAMAGSIILYDRLAKQNQKTRSTAEAARHCRQVDVHVDD